MSKRYMIYGIDTAMHFLRPSARWEIANGQFTRWEDPRPCPTWEEVMETMEKIKAFEDSIETIWLPEQIRQMEQKEEEIQKVFEQ